MKDRAFRWKDFLSLSTTTVVQNLYKYVLVAIFGKCIFSHTVLTRPFGNRGYGADLCCSRISSVQSKCLLQSQPFQGSSKKWIQQALILVQLFFLGNFLGAWLFLFTVGFMSWHKPWGISLPQSTWYWELANCFQVFLKARLGSALLANWPPAVTHLFSLFFFVFFLSFVFVLFYH